MNGTTVLTDQRCPKCKTLLMRAARKDCDIEIKCRKCGAQLHINPAMK